MLDRGKTWLREQGAHSLTGEMIKKQAVMSKRLCNGRREERAPRELLGGVCSSTLVSQRNLVGRGGVQG